MQRTPWPEQEPLPQVAPSQVSVPQHCVDDEQEPPELTQPLAPTQTPPEQVIAPQQSELRMQSVPAD